MALGDVAGNSPRRRRRRDPTCRRSVSRPLALALFLSASRSRSLSLAYPPTSSSPYQNPIGSSSSQPPGLTRYGSAPSSLIATAVDAVVGAESDFGTNLISSSLLGGGHGHGHRSPSRARISVSVVFPSRTSRIALYLFSHPPRPSPRLPSPFSRPC